MNTYRNVKTGATVQIDGQAAGDWVLVEPAPASVSDPEPEQPKEQPKKKRASKKK